MKRKLLSSLVTEYITRIFFSRPLLGCSCCIHPCCGSGKPPRNFFWRIFRLNWALHLPVPPNSTVYIHQDHQHSRQTSGALFEIALSVLRYPPFLRGHWTSRLAASRIRAHSLFPRRHAQRPAHSRLRYTSETLNIRFGAEARLYNTLYRFTQSGRDRRKGGKVTEQGR